MMRPSKSLDRIEKSAFHPKEYVGYADGVWIIRRASYGWFARHRDDPARALIVTRTLREMNDKFGATAPDRLLGSFAGSRQ